MQKTDSMVSLAPISTLAQHPWQEKPNWSRKVKKELTLWNGLKFLGLRALLKLGIKLEVHLG